MHVVYPCCIYFKQHMKPNHKAVDEIHIRHHKSADIYLRGFPHHNPFFFSCFFSCFFLQYFGSCDTSSNTKKRESFSIIRKHPLASARPSCEVGRRLWRHSSNSIKKTFSNNGWILSGSQRSLKSRNVPNNNALFPAAALINAWPSMARNQNEATHIRLHQQPHIVVVVVLNADSHRF